MADRLVVHIIDHDDDTRRAVAFLLRVSGIRAQEHESVGSFLHIANRVDAGCILLDIRANRPADHAPLLALRRLRARFPTIGIVSGTDFSSALEATHPDVTRYLHRPIDKLTLLGAIHEAFAELERADTDARDGNEALLKVSSLTPREQDVLRALARGQSNKLMAIELGISSRTAEIHRAHVMTKLNAHSLSEALQVAFSAGIR